MEIAAQAKAAASAGAKVEQKVKQELGFEYLNAAYKEVVKRVQDLGVGVCSKCRWTCGCKDCSYDKSLVYWLKQQYGE